MAVLGLSILIATFSFFCYRHPPSTWSLLTWFQTRRPPPPPSITEPKDAPSRIELDTPSITTSTPDKEESIPVGEGPGKKERKDEEVREENIGKEGEDRDRIAMPPPPPPTFTKSRPTSPLTPRASTSDHNTNGGIPSFTLHDGNKNEEEEEDYDAMPPPQFPALNSAQRAGGGGMKAPQPPRLSGMGSSMGPPPRPGGSASLMAPPQRGGPLPNRNPLNRPTAGAGLTPPPTHAAPPPKPKRKVQLTPGHSPLDWASLTSSSSLSPANPKYINLRGLPPNTPYLKVPPSLLKQMNGRKGRDAWTILGGRVYNITPYKEFHPGGVPELMRCAGKDGTRMFGEVHPWVNWEGMLEGCLVGVGVEEEGVRKMDEEVTGSGMEDMD